MKYRLPRQHGRTSELRRNLRSIMLDGAAFGLMIGIGETYVPAFALALGMGEVAVGMIATLPMLAGGVLQLVSPRAIRGLGSHRRWVVTCASLQAISVLLLVAIALAGRLLPAWLVFVPTTLYWAAGLATGPAWNTWIEDLVPKRVRPTFFARRVRVSQISLLVGLVARAATLILVPHGAGGRAKTSMLATRTIAVRPSLGGVDRPILPSIIEPVKHPEDELAESMRAKQCNIPLEQPVSSFQDDIVIVKASSPHHLPA